MDNTLKFLTLMLFQTWLSFFWWWWTKKKRKDIYFHERLNPSWQATFSELWQTFWQDSLNFMNKRSSSNINRKLFQVTWSLKLQSGIFPLWHHLCSKSASHLWNYQLYVSCTSTPSTLNKMNTMFEESVRLLVITIAVNPPVFSRFLTYFSSFSAVFPL